MKYRFRALPELYWSVLTSAATVLLLALVAFDPTTIADWRAWAVALGSGMLRSAAGAALDWIRRSMTDEPEPTLADRVLALTADERAALTDELERRAYAEAKLRADSHQADSLEAFEARLRPEERERRAGMERWQREGLMQHALEDSKRPTTEIRSHGGEGVPIRMSDDEIVRRHEGIG